MYRGLPDACMKLRNFYLFFNASNLFVRPLSLIRKSLTRLFLEASQTQYTRWSFARPRIRAIRRLRMTASFLVRGGFSFRKYVILFLAGGLLAFLGLQDSLPG